MRKIKKGYMKKGAEDLQGVIEDVTFILNNIRNKKFKQLEKTKLTEKQEEMLETIEKDLEVAVTKLGLVLHATEL